MSESSRSNADGGEADSLNVEDLFATDDTDVSIEESPDERTGTPEADASQADAEDTTADELFSQLRDEHGADEPAADAVTEESPEDIMARADQEAAHVDQVDDAIRADEDALDDLLLTGRREADGFLWVETEDDADDGFGAMFESDDTADGSSTTDDDGGTGDDVASAADTDSADDDFELSASADFEDRALTFDDGDDSTEALEADTADGGDDEREDVGAEARNGDGSEDDGDDEGGLADRIRSILSG